MTEPLTQQGSTDDWLGYGAYADALWGRVVRALDKDQGGKPLGDDPLVIGIFGEWGAGKSHLLKLVYERAQEQSARDIAARVLNASSKLPLTVTVPVMFQPWKYEHEPHLHVPMAIHVADALEDAWKKLPSDIEKVKVWVASSVALGATAKEKFEVVTTALGKLNTFIKKTKAFVKSDAADVVAGTLDVMATAMLVPPVLSLGLSRVRERLGDDEADDEESAKQKPTTDKKPEGPKKTSAEKKTQEFSHSKDGLAFYRIEKLIRAMTRPKLSAKLLADAGLKIADGIEFDLRINFVVFVDDLDRCLPEKAVETLELIKTMFNIESFAFVLALDDEVIERGIGHRYKDYHLQGKKPEMPITGFEYLEKIIHLPFRLPALTREQAGAFVRKYESDIQPNGALRWFDKPVPIASSAIDEAGEPGTLQNRSANPSTPPTDLLELALSGFDAFMPRKLIRLVELLHQVAAIARLRKKPLQPTYAGEVDVRVVLVLLLIQLFQPELFRVMRRRADSFPTLLAAFAVRPVLGASTTPESPDLPNAQMADIDLWRWAVNPKDAALEWEPKPLEPLHSHAAHCIAQAFKGKPDERTSRTSAQQVRLPIVLQLIEHRAAQRHVFDVLKLTKRLADEMSRTGSAAHELVFEPYRSLLAQPMLALPVITAFVNAREDFQDTVTASGTVGSMPSKTISLLTGQREPTFALSNVEELAQLLVSPETEAQANMTSRLELRAGHVLDDRSVENLVTALNAKLTQGAAGDMQAKQVRTLNGLQYLAPFLSSASAGALWKLVADSVNLQNELDPKLRALWGDVRAKLGCDPRFESTGLRLAKKDVEDLPTAFSTKGDQVPGFAFIDARSKPFWFGGAGIGSSKPVKVLGIAQPFYMARTLTTVAQYAQFVDSTDYANHFEGEGAQWLSGNYDTKVTSDQLKKWLARRPKELRHQPFEWQDQLANPLRPIIRITWFEAQAYVHWLHSSLAQHGLGGYRASLPTELQWECAARYDTSGVPSQRPFPWKEGPGSADVDRQAFVVHANLGHLVGAPTTIGLYPKGLSPTGLADMAGNVWEWMEHGYVDGYDPMKALDKQEMYEYRTLRGGSWVDSPGLPQCSSRRGSPPDYWFNYVGFRVVLSLAD